MKFHIKFYLSSLFILFSFIGTLQASHAVGGEITYKCLGNYQYEIHFTFYRDCGGISAPSQMVLDIENSCGYPSSSVFLDPISSPSVISYSWLCPSATTTCNGGIYTGIEKWDYIDTITLPGECNSWTFSHTEGVRNLAITTITGNGIDNLYLYSTCDNTNGKCFDSPVFSTVPIIFLCLGEYLCFDNGVYVSSGDSLTFQLITPRTGPTAADTVSYLSGYNALQPLISSPPISLNTNTGEICMHPTQPDVTPMALLVNQIKNGNIIGQVERDIQVAVHNCSNNSPTLTGFNGTPAQSITVCANQQNCFYVTSFDPDTLNSTWLSWNNINLTSAMTSNNSGGIRDTIFFCWTPTNADAINNPNCFRVDVSDDNCPYLGKNHATLCMTVDTTPGCIPTLVKFLETNFSFNIYPQPASNKLSFDLGSDEVFRNGTMQLFDSFGRSVYSSIIQNNQFSIDITLPSGIFYAIVLNEKGTSNIKKQIIILKE